MIDADFVLYRVALRVLVMFDAVFDITCVVFSRGFQ